MGIAGIVLFIVGIVLSYLSWINKKELDYVEKKRIENGGISLEESMKPLQEKVKKNEKISFGERFSLWNLHLTRFGNKALIFGTYFGLVLSVVGLLLFVLNKVAN
ncbi:MAG: hypothetical protein GQ531_11750 [Sulfurovum sp.]|nr:hypothetical protein [Sulfurovum sp.]